MRAFCMANFHPIDVRYKGPSTSYRGSPVAQPISVSGAIKTELPKVKRKARRPRARSNFTANLLTWVFKKWGGFIAALSA